MKTISMLELRKNGPGFINALKKSKKPFSLTYRGKEVAIIYPASESRGLPQKDDIFYRITEISVKGKELNNTEIDDIIYHQKF